jgi:hypothetical protein
MQTSPTIENIAAAFVKFQTAVKNPENSRENPFFKKKYAPLDKILAETRPLLGDNGLSVVQDSYADNGSVFVNTILIHTSGEWIMTGPLAMTPDKPTPQGVGSALTYARRYALCAILGIAGEEDDDANTAEPKGNPASAANEPKPHINEKQAQLVHIWVTKAGLTETEIKDKYHITNFKELTKTQMDEIADDLVRQKLMDRRIDPDGKVRLYSPTEIEAMKQAEQEAAEYAGD